MGHNIDFCDLLNLPKKVICPRCMRETFSYFDDYDIDCGSPQASQSNQGMMTLNVNCSHCEYDFEVRIKCEIEIDEYRE